MATAIVTSFDQQSDSSGNPISGAKINVYNVGSTTLKTVYSDTGLSVSVANPIVCDSAGRHDMRYIANGAYKILVTTSAGVTVYTRDNIDPGVPIGSGTLAIANGGTGQTTGSAALSALGGATSAELSALASNVAALTGATSSTEKTHIATGTTAQRPASPAAGDLRRNSTTSSWEGYNGSAWQNFSISPPTRQYLTSGTGATYTTPTGAKYLAIRMVGGGGGGGATVTNAGSNGTASVFNSIAADFGEGGGAGPGGSGNNSGGVGGSGGAGAASLRISGGAGDAGTTGSTADGVAGNGGRGGSSAFGGAGESKTGAAGGGTAASANSGSGGSGATTNAATRAGAGGGAGEYVELLITSPAATYTYTVGASGAGGTAGTNAGGAGGSGLIIVEEFY